MICLSFLLLLLGATSKKIIDKPIIFNKERDQLTLEYLSSHYGLVQDLPTIIPKMIVLHWTEISTSQKYFEAFYSVKLPDWRSEIKSSSSLIVSSQFLVDQDDTIYR